MRGRGLGKAWRLGFSYISLLWIAVGIEWNVFPWCFIVVDIILLAVVVVVVDCLGEIGRIQ